MTNDHDILIRIEENIKNIKDDIETIKLNIEKHNKAIDKIEKRVFKLELNPKIASSNIDKKKWFSDPGTWAAIIAGAAIAVYLLFKHVVK